MNSRNRTPTKKARDQGISKSRSRYNFTRRTNAYKALKKLFETKQITGMENASVVKQMNPLFFKYNSDQFRTGYNNFKHDFISVEGTVIDQCFDSIQC